MERRSTVGESFSGYRGGMRVVLVALVEVMVLRDVVYDDEPDDDEVDVEVDDDALWMLVEFEDGRPLWAVEEGRRCVFVEEGGTEMLMRDEDPEWRGRACCAGRGDGVES